MLIEKPALFNRIKFWIKFFFYFLFPLVILYFSLSFTTYSLPKIVIIQTLVLLMIGFWFLEMTLLGEISLKKSYLLFPILIFLILSIFSLTWAVSISGGISLLWQFFSYILLYFIIVNYFSEKELPSWAFILVLAGAIMSTYGILQYFGIEPFLKDYDYIPKIPLSTLGNRNQVAQFLIIVIPLSAIFSLLSHQWHKRAFFLLSTFIMGYHLILTKSRGAFIGLLLSFLVLFSLSAYKALKNWKKGRIIKITSLSFFLGLTLTLFILLFSLTLYLLTDLPEKGLKSDSIEFPKIEENLTINNPSWLKSFFYRSGIMDEEKALSARARVYIYHNTLRIIKDYPLRGVGFGNFKYVYPRYRDRAEWAISGLNTRVEEAHNEYLQIFSEVGLFGFLIFMFIIFRIIKMSLNLFRKEEFNQSFFLSMALTAGILSTLIQSLFDFNLQNPASAITFWSSVGFLEILYQRQREYRKAILLRLRGRLFLLYSLRGGILFSIILGLIFSIKPLLGDYHLKVGRFYMEISNWKGALYHFEKGKKFCPNHFDIYFHLGQTYDQLKNYEKAIESYKKSILLHPCFIEAKNNLGVIYLRAGRIEEAIEEFKNAISINTFHPALHNNLGYIYSKKNLIEEAFSEYIKALELEPENPEILKNISILFSKRGRDGNEDSFPPRDLLITPNDSQKSIKKTKESQFSPS
ncbi:MAG: tetratricopeptide repeat protein [Thermodesulfobacteriota bacterium]